jgi:hypothetical protein
MKLLLPNLISCSIDVSSLQQSNTCCTVRGSEDDPHGLQPKWQRRLNISYCTAWAKSHYISAVKVKLSLCLVKHHVKNMYSEVEVQLHVLASALDGGEWWISLPGRFIPSQKPPVTIGQKVGWAPEPVWTLWKGKYGGGGSDKYLAL